MQRLLKDAEKISGIKYDISSFADITQAIHVIQEEMGIAGTTALEAGTTIQGSVNAMKSAWQNLITGLADGNANIETLINNLVTTIVGDGTESNLGVIGNVLPAIETALGGAVKLIEGLSVKIIEIIPGLIESTLPSLVSGALTIVQSFVSAISNNSDLLIQSGMSAIITLANGILSMLPEIIKVGLDLIVSLALGIANSLPELIPTLIDTIVMIVDTLTNPDMLSKILDAALVLIVELAYGLMDAIPELVDACLDIIDNLVVFLTDPNNLAKLINAAIKLIIALGTGIINAIPRLVGQTTTLISKVIDNFRNTDWGTVGKNIVDGLLGGLKKAWESLKTWFKNAASGLVSSVKKTLGIASPSKVFAEIGGFMAEGLGVGWDKDFGSVNKDIQNSLNFNAGTIDYELSNVSRETNVILQALNGMGIYLAPGKLVGYLTPDINKSLGQLSVLQARGV